MPKTIQCTFPSNSANPRAYTYLCDEEQWEKIAVGSRVVVSTTRGTSIVTVVGKEDQDLNPNIEYKNIGGIYE